MQFKLFVYCESVEIDSGDAKKEYLAETEKWNQPWSNEKLAGGAVTVKEFADKAALYGYINAFNFTRDGVAGNRILDALIMNPNDSRRHKRFYKPWFSSAEVFLRCGYLVQDEYGRTLDLRECRDEILSSGAKVYPWLRSKPLTDEQLASKIAEDARRTLHLELAWGGNRKWWSYCRRIQTTHERRFACDTEHKPFVRGRRSYSSLPNTYDDLFFPREKTWKSRTKVKYQWMVNHKRHIDTVALPKVKSEGNVDFEDDKAE